MSSRPGRVLAIALGLLVATTGACAQAGQANPTTHQGGRESASAASSRSAAQAPAAKAPRPAVTKVLTFMVENHTIDEMKSEMPFVYGLARHYAYADRYKAITHPSLPNYLAIASGGTQGVTDDSSPADHPLTGQTVFDQALALGRTAKIYADSMTSNCELDSDGEYAVRHNPWAYFVDGRAACLQHDVPATRLAADSRAGRLPNVGMVVPNLIHDAHDGTLAQADAWIKQQIRTLRLGPDWKSGHLAIVITADEDDQSGPNRVLTVVASRYQRHLVVHTPLSHYSLTGLYEAVVGARPLGSAATARSMAKAFGIKLSATG